MMKRRLAQGLLGSLAPAIAAALVLGASASAQQSLRAIRAQESEESDLAGEAAYTSSVCDASIEAVIDWRSASDWPAGESIVDSCDGALGALEAMCRRDRGGKGARSISKFVCAGDGSGPSLRGSTLRYGARPGVNGFSETMSYLEGAF